jgi:hypothetical protein
MIYTFGNSHAHFFTGTHPGTSGWGKKTKNFSSFSLGPVIAFNFFENHYQKLLDIIGSIKIDSNDFLMITVGEVDCRWHLPYQSFLQKRDIGDIVFECLERFFRVYLDLKKRGYNVICWAGHPSTTSEHDENPNSPVFGTCLERNRTTLIWESRLKKLCQQHDIPLVSLVQDLIDENGLTNMDYFIDYCHLDSDKLHFIVDNKFKEFFR